MEILNWKGVMKATLIRSEGTRARMTDFTWNLTSKNYSTSEAIFIYRRALFCYNSRKKSLVELTKFPMKYERTRSYRNYVLFKLNEISGNLSWNFLVHSYFSGNSVNPNSRSFFRVQYNSKLNHRYKMSWGTYTEATYMHNTRHSAKSTHSATLLKKVSDC